MNQIHLIINDQYDDAVIACSCVQFYSWLLPSNVLHWHTCQQCPGPMLDFDDPQKHLMKQVSLDNQFKFSSVWIGVMSLGQAVM